MFIKNMSWTYQPTRRMLRRGGGTHRRPARGGSHGETSSGCGGADRGRVAHPGPADQHQVPAARPDLDVRGPRDAPPLLKVLRARFVRDVRRGSEEEERRV